MNIKIDINPDVSLDMFDLEIHLAKAIFEDLKKEIEDKVSGWVQKGVEEGYGGGYMHYGGDYSWDKNNEWVRVPLDMGSADEEVAFNELEKIILPYPVEQIRIGYDYPEDRYEMNEEEKQLLKELNDLKKTSS